MIGANDIDLYKKLAVLFGGFQDLIQGAGGNLSIKTDTQIIIKSSGTCLSEIDKYCICSLPDLQILGGSGKPSMEAGFHCLPKRIIVHFHSISFLSTWNGQGLCLPYIQPGESLSEKLHHVYTGESIIYLANHGIILLADTEEELYSLLQSIYSVSFMRTFDSIKQIYEKTNSVFLELSNLSHFLFFKPFTPDLFLFLGKKPFRLLSEETPIECQLAEYEQETGRPPSIVYIGKSVFCIAPSWKKCILIRDMYDAYCKIIQIPPSTELSLDDCQNLLACEKEAYRLRT